ncbi:hypothetical protein HYX58_02115 [Candidatus Dependentiae bacterium]|nr:hypothetical protein [Candidatus Dependentiae bacterium]
MRLSLILACILFVQINANSSRESASESNQQSLLKPFISAKEFIFPEKDTLPKEIKAAIYTGDYWKLNDYLMNGKPADAKQVKRYLENVIDRCERRGFAYEYDYQEKTLKDKLIHHALCARVNGMMRLAYHYKEMNAARKLAMPNAQQAFMMSNI